MMMTMDLWTQHKICCTEVAMNTSPLLVQHAYSHCSLYLCGCILQHSNLPECL